MCKQKDQGAEKTTQKFWKCRSMKREMEDRENKWERQQQIREDFLEAAARKKEQMWE